jgi:hypothetical protein
MKAVPWTVLESMEKESMAEANMTSTSCDKAEDVISYNIKQN